MYLAYYSIADLNEIILRKLNIFPHDIDLIVGVPRSGMLPANLLALYLNKPFTDIDSFVAGRIYSSGERGALINKRIIKKILVVDDSINSGNALMKAKVKLESLFEDFNIKFAAIIATTLGSKLVDYYCKIVDYPRVFQWNIFHHSLVSQACFDIDGVLCVDPPVDDDGPLYLDYISNAKPLYIPTVEIDTLVSCRLEKYRKVTEEWLAKNNVKYKHLIMLNMKTKDERIAWGKHGEYKGKIYKESKNILFIESSLKQAIQISKISGKPVFCIQTFSMINSHVQFEKCKYTTMSKFKSLLRPAYHLFKKY